MKRYSQNLEQDYILEYFQGRKGTFIDIGANSGIDLSNTRALAELGWSGCFIEPSPKAFEKLKENYKGLSGFYFYNLALGDHNGNAILQESSSLLNAADVGLVSTFESSEMQRFKSICTYEPVTVKMFKWKTFYNRLRIKEFTFISLDIEGFELKVLPDMDLTKTEMLCIEHNGSKEKKEQYLYYTSKYGMDKIIYESGENIIIVR
jgi:FkbM family methyltransferase